MKRLVLTALICAAASFSFAQNTTTTTTVTTTTVVKNDTTIVKKDSTVEKGVSRYRFSFGDRQRRRDSLKAAAERKEKFNFNVIFRFDLA